MNMNEYQASARTTACYPTEGLMGLLYPVLGLAGESGEVAEKVKKVIRRNGEFDADVKLQIARELGDVLWYVANLAHELGYDLDTIARMNIDKLADRKERGVVKGEGDHR